MMQHGNVNEPLDEAKLTAAVADEWVMKRFGHPFSDSRLRMQFEDRAMFPPAPSEPAARKAFLDHTKERAVVWLELGGVVPNLKALAESEGLDIRETVFERVLHAVQLKHERLLVTHQCVSKAQEKLWCQRAQNAKDSIMMWPMKATC